MQGSSCRDGAGSAVWDGAAPCGVGAAVPGGAGSAVPSLKLRQCNIACKILHVGMVPVPLSGMVPLHVGVDPLSQMVPVPLSLHNKLNSSSHHLVTTALPL